MDVDRVEEVVLTDSQKVWREVKDCLGSEDYDKAIQLCNTGEPTSSLSQLGRLFCSGVRTAAAHRRQVSTAPLADTSAVSTACPPSHTKQ